MYKYILWIAINTGRENKWILRELPRVFIFTFKLNSEVYRLWKHNAWMQIPAQLCDITWAHYSSFLLDTFSSGRWDDNIYFMEL